MMKLLIEGPALLAQRLYLCHYFILVQATKKVRRGKSRDRRKVEENSKI
jgi:hypothetical protein